MSVKNAIIKPKSAQEGVIRNLQGDRKLEIVRIWMAINNPKAVGMSPGILVFDFISGNFLPKYSDKALKLSINEIPKTIRVSTAQTSDTCTSSFPS